MLPGDMDCEAGVEKAERKKVAAAAWMKWIQTAQLLVNKNVPLVKRANTMST